MKMNTMNCNTCRNSMEEALLEPGYVPDAAMAAHLDACAACRAEWNELRATFAMLDEWTAPEPSPYFDARVRAHLQSTGAATPSTLWERLSAMLHLSTGRGLRPALAGLFVFILLLGGGTVATLWGGHSAAKPASAASPTINDLKILDNNAQALQQLDMLDDQGSQAPEPQS